MVDIALCGTCMCQLMILWHWTFYEFRRFVTFGNVCIYDVSVLCTDTFIYDYVKNKFLLGRVDSWHSWRLDIIANVRAEQSFGSNWAVLEAERPLLGSNVTKSEHVRVETCTASEHSGQTVTLSKIGGGLTNYQGTEAGEWAYLWKEETVNTQNNAAYIGFASWDPGHRWLLIINVQKCKFSYKEISSNSSAYVRGGRESKWTGVIQFSKMKNFDAKNFSPLIRENFLTK
jgi:hypothetical protein